MPPKDFGFYGFDPVRDTCLLYKRENFDYKRKRTHSGEKAVI